MEINAGMSERRRGQVNAVEGILGILPWVKAVAVGDAAGEASGRMASMSAVAVAAAVVASSSAADP